MPLALGNSIIRPTVTLHYEASPSLLQKNGKGGIASCLTSVSHTSQSPAANNYPQKIQHYCDDKNIDLVERGEMELFEIEEGKSYENEGVGSGKMTTKRKIIAGSVMAAGLVAGALITVSKILNVESNALSAINGNQRQPIDELLYAEGDVNSTMLANNLGEWV